LKYKYFVISDVHNHFTEMMKALNAEGFDINNQNHKLVLVGDAFDRGSEAFKVFTFLKELTTKNKLVWIAGNHEHYLLKRFKENSFKTHNETFSTLSQIAEGVSGKINLSDLEVFEYCRKSGFEEFIKSNVLGFFETENYIFVHGALPTIKGEYDPNWRSVPLTKWCMPSGRNGMKSVMVDGIRVPGKTLVCGHSPAAYGNVRANTNPADWDNKEFNKLQRIKSDSSNVNIYKPFYGNGVIGIDANCYKTGFVNCIVIEEEDVDGK